MTSFKYVSRLIDSALIAGALFLFGLHLVGCSHVTGSGYPLEEARIVAPFEELVVSGHMIVHLDIGENYAVSVYGDDNVVAATNVTMDGRALRIQAPKSIIQKQPLEVTVVTPVLKRMYAALTEDVSVNVAGRRLEKVSIQLSGVGRLAVHRIKAGAISAQVEGTGTLAMDGVAEHLDFRLSGMGSGAFEKLCLTSAQIWVHGMGKVTVNARDYLDATVKGIGKVTYLGTPSLNRNVAGGGKIEPATDAAAAACGASAAMYIPTIDVQSDM